MLKEKGQYINLVSESNKIADIAEKKYIPETRTVYLSGNLRKLFKDRTKGITILKSEHGEPTPLIDLKRLFKYLLAGLGFGAVVTGVFFMFDKRTGEQNG